MQHRDSPFPASPSQDPFLSLSNRRLQQQAPSPLTHDRFLSDLEPIKCKLNFDAPQPTSTTETSTTHSIKKSRKEKIYHSALGWSLGQNKNRGQYKAKAKRTGYLDFYEGLNHEEDKQDNPPRQFPKNSYKVLNAPRLKDDFYTSLLDWSRDDMIAVVLDNAVYSWASRGNDAQKVVEGYVSSVRWGKGLAVGEETGRIRVIDIEKRKQTARSRNHLGRVGVMDFSSSGNEIASGSKDSEVLIWDVRQKEVCQRFEGHHQQICGLRWSPNNNMLASGGNDNLVYVWQPRVGRHIGKLTQHTAAIKALAWSPHKSHLLATGGGSTDKSVKMWNTAEMTCVKSADTGSQVCNMLFSTSTNELLTTHGYSLNSIMVWNARNMQPLATLCGHSYRVLYLAKSPDEETILTGSGDQTLRFWKLFPAKNQTHSRTCLSPLASVLR